MFDALCIVRSYIVQGHAYRLGDFVVRVGKCKKGAVFRGLALEVIISYCPFEGLVTGTGGESTRPIDL